MEQSPPVRHFLPRYNVRHLMPQPSTHHTNHLFQSCFQVHIFPLRQAVPGIYQDTADANFHQVHRAPLQFQTQFNHIPFHTPIQPPLSIIHHRSFHSPHPYSITHMGYTRPPWAATRVTLHSYSRLDPTPGSSPGCSRVSSRTQGLRIEYKTPNSHRFLSLSL